jgi:hypothetical protein
MERMQKKSCGFLPIAPRPFNLNFNFMAAPVNEMGPDMGGGRG